MNTDSKTTEILDAESVGLRLKIQNFSLTLDRLTSIQERFIDLSQVYQELKHDIKLSEAKLEAVDQLSQQFSDVIRERESSLESLQTAIQEKLTEIQSHHLEISQHRENLLADQQKDEIKAYLTPLTEQINQSQDFVLGAMESTIRKYETQVRELRRDLQTMSRLGLFAIVGLSLALLITWILLSGHSNVIQS